MLTLSAVYTDELGELVEKRCLEQCPDGYPMTIADLGEWSAIAEAVSMGIDEYLEAITDRSNFDEGNCVVHPRELKTLVRRLMQGVRSNNKVVEAGIDLAMSICISLDIELI